MTTEKVPAVTVPEEETALRYEKAVSYINDIPRFGGKASPESLRFLLDRMGAPDRKMRIIHVAGTNGKGSVCCFMESVLRHAGMKTGLFISPHLIDIRERICINNRMISRAEFLEAFDAVKETVDGAADAVPHPAYFDFLFLMAMYWFARELPDIVILETGLGGRLDATNSVSVKEVCVITRIGMDHMQYLGNTISAIAGEKAAICRKDTPVVTLTGPQEAFAVIRDHAAAAGAVLKEVPVPDEESVRLSDGILEMRTELYAGRPIRIRTHTFARYQAENIALVVKALSLIPEVTEEAVKEGFLAAHWSCRMDEVIPGVFVDGAHNADGISAFLDSVRRIPKAEDAGRKLIFAMMRDKQSTAAAAMLAASGLFDTIAVVSLNSKRALDGEELQALFRDTEGVRITAAGSPEEAAAMLLREREAGDLIFCAGSLYLAGDVLAYVMNRPADRAPAKGEGHV